MVPSVVPVIPPEIKAHGPAIRAIREARGYSVNRVATHIGVTRQYLGRLEAGKRGATQQTLKALADAYGVSVDALTVPVTTSVPVAS